MNTLRQSGFTIVELLIVIVVIGILAAITIISFNGISMRATIATVQSDLSSSAQVLGSDNATSGTYPSSQSAANGGSGLKSSSGTTLTYTYSSSDNTYCLMATNGSIVYFVSSGDSRPTAGSCPAANGGVVTTLAGSGAASYADGTGTAAQFNQPRGIVVDTSGNLFVGDMNNQRIRKVTSSGVVTTFAGSGSNSYVDGTGTAAAFNLPQGVAIDTGGNLYIADSSNDCIRKITTVAVVSVVAGTCSLTTGYADGTGTAAKFFYPRGITVDSSGVIYVADTGNNMIRKITSSGVVTTLAGNLTAGYTDATGTAAKFNGPRALAVDSSGNLYVADSGNNVIRKVTSSGVVTTLAGSGVAGYADGSGTAAKFNGLYGITIDTTGNLYIGDTSNNRIRKVTLAGVVTTIAGSGVAGSANGVGTTAQFNGPAGITVDSSGTIYVDDYVSNLIRKIQ